MFPMSHVRATISGTATGKNKSDRVGHWTVELQLLTASGAPDPRPEARKQLSGDLPGATHNQAALEAVRQALDALTREGVTVTVQTTNDYLVGVLARHWKPSRNQERIAAAKALIAKHTITFERV